ncbi:ABC transporter substrate-binding protein [Halococcus saccharolyticus]|uniref:Amino acid-binding protein n=1 Tax=Halococcus saccharolyticus DSM 5350 TaxID=1227455 RepID=M0MHX6_9EURY|nr:ABC transporter substrate-binding protein [Halococcus saccharolyticus]EMA45306.1 amino acid-binding protein [Halococcus saccharolyticus DSM 5350]
MRSASSRRRFLALAGAAGLTGLAGCSGGGGGNGSNDSGQSGGDSGGGDGSGGSAGGNGSDGSGDGNTSGDTGGNGTGGNESGSGGGGSADLGSVTVGILNPISGAYSSLGPGQRSGAELAVEQINESDQFGVEIDPVYADTETATSAAQGSAQRLVQEEGAEYLFGAISSSVALSLNEFAASEELIYFPGGAAVPITGENCNEWVFRCETNTAQIAEAISGYSVNNLGTNVWFHIADYAYGESVYNRVSSRMQSANDSYQEVDLTRSQLGSSNFGSFISQISNSNAEVVVLGMTGGDLVNFVNQAADQGLTDQVNLVGPTMSFQSVRAATGSNAIGTYGGVRYDPSIDLGDNQQFVEAFQNANDGPPGNFARVGYDSVRLIARGIQEAGSTDPADVRDALSGGTFTTVLGDVTLRESDHQATNPTWMSELVEGDGDMADVELIDKTEGEEALPPASELGCSLN